MGSAGHSRWGVGVRQDSGAPCLPLAGSLCRQGAAPLFWAKSGPGVAWALARRLLLPPGESELKPHGTRHQKSSLVSTKPPVLSALGRVLLWSVDWTHGLPLASRRGQDGQDVPSPVSYKKTGLGPALALRTQSSGSWPTCCLLPPGQSTQEGAAVPGRHLART